MALNQYSDKIKELFATRQVPICAKDIITQLQHNQINPNKTTIYRTLNSLVRQNYLKQIIIDTNTCYYEKADEHHHHFYCTKCKNFEDLDPDETSEAKLIKKLQGKKILFHTMEFFGLCEKCQ